MNIILNSKTHKITSIGVRGGAIKKAGKSTTERAWRDSELLRTDEFVKLPDYPIDLLPYRMELRDYPAKFDFPNGDRPTM